MGGDSAGIARKHTYDAAGQLLETRRYFELGTTKEVWVAPVDRPPAGGRQGPMPATPSRSGSELATIVPAPTECRPVSTPAIISEPIATAVDIAVADGNAVLEVTEGWTGARQVVHMQRPIGEIARGRIAALPVRYWRAEATPHNHAEEGFYDESGRVAIAFPMCRNLASHPCVFPGNEKA